MPTVDLSNLPLVVNDVFYPLMWDEHRFFALKGGAGSGKSVFCAQKCVVRAMVEEGHHIGIFRKVAKTLKVSVVEELRKAIKMLGVEKLWEHNKTDQLLTFRPNGSRIRCLGIDDPEKLKSIDSLTSAWLEEVTEFTRSDVQQVNLRMRGLFHGYKQMLVSFNPISALHWIKGHFFDADDPERIATMTSTYKDNRFIDPEYGRELEKLVDEDEYAYRVYTLGEWGILSGLIYKPFDFSPWPQPLSADETIFGIDFGFSNPACLYRISLKDTEAYVTELFYTRGLTTSDMADRMDHLTIRPYERIYADGAEPDRIVELRRRGFNVVPADKSAGSVRAGISTCMATHIHTKDENVNFNKEAVSYKWREDAAGDPLDEPAKFMDHAMDAMRYALHTHKSGLGQFELT